jgi:hypothetical protein
MFELRVGFQDLRETKSGRTDGRTAIVIVSTQDLKRREEQHTKKSDKNQFHVFVFQICDSELQMTKLMARTVRKHNQQGRRERANKERNEPEGKVGYVGEESRVLY